MEISRSCILFAYLFYKHPTASADGPCGAAWHYDMESGGCYRKYNDPNTRAASATLCAVLDAASGAWAGRTGLATARTAAEAGALARYLEGLGDYSESWAALSRVSSTAAYTWDDGDSYSPLSPQDWSAPASPSHNCAAFKLEVENPYTWNMAAKLVPKNCNDVWSRVCQYYAKPCPLAGLTNNHFNTTTMLLSPDRLTPDSNVQVECRPGFYRLSETGIAPAPTVPPAVPPVAAGGNAIAANTARCTYSHAGAQHNPATVLVQWQLPSPPLYDKMEVCLPIHCIVFKAALTNVETNEMNSADPTQWFPYGKMFVVTCAAGYVNFRNASTTTSAMTCTQSQTNRSLGVWAPLDMQPCKPVRCNEEEMINTVPRNGKLKRAVDRTTAREYDAFQVNQFNQYNNIVYVSCPHGLFFEDRTFEKSILCGLQPRKLLLGKWYGYQGTSLPLTMACVGVQCKQQNAKPPREYHLKQHFIIESNGMSINATAHNGTDYSYLTELVFECEDGYSLWNKETTLRLKCMESGEWLPKLASCVKVTASFTSGIKGKHYVSPAVEAQNAKSVGVVVIIVLVFFLALILILDIATISRDMRMLRRNLLNIKRKLS